MSLSTVYTRVQPPICSRHPHAAPPEPPPIDWVRVKSTSLAAALATFLSQIPSAPLDLASKLVQNPSKSAPKTLPVAMLQLFKHHSWREIVSVICMGCVKRVPTKALTVTFFELGTQLLVRRNQVEHVSAAQHLNIATLSGVLAVMLTFPLHSLYYATRKGVTCAQVLEAYTTRRRVMFSGAIPALASTVPAVFVDYSIYKTLRAAIDNHSTSSAPSTVSIVAAATTANLLGGVLAEPFKAVSRRVAVESVKNVCCGSVGATTRQMLHSGLGEFWRGYQRRVVRYAVSAVVSKTAVRYIRHPRQQQAQLAISDRVMVLPGRRRVGWNVSSSVACSTSHTYSFR
eukprot:TRINITY_DN55678_c0_g1_i1.p1 TRINITY_DN55678_c0_g1~~TRINITY_DN55678_c0_g1_i1.p1  ORF type:complete len:343 (-),score=41.96 TRINITY_DN55678_c0_g1_i1:48-1076(-)